jgi:hypothetical protein
MKKLILLSLLIFGVSAQASSMEDQLEKLVEARKAANEAIEDYYYVFFDQLEYNEMSSAPEKECRSYQNYNVISAEELISKINSVFAVVDKYTSQPIYSELEVLSALLPLYEILRHDQLRVCTEKSVPAYSDGQEITYVTVNGDLSFMFGFGRPD